MKAGAFLRQLAREARGQRVRLTFFVACLAVGVAAVVAVAGLAASLDGAIRSQARSLLAADLAISGRQPLTEELGDALVEHAAGSATAEIREMVTVVAAGDGPTPKSRLVELKAVTASYPFYGDLVLAPPPPSPLSESEAWAAPELLSALGIGVGDEIRIGGEPFRVAAAVQDEPDRIAGAFTLGPRLFVSIEGLDRAGLIQRGSRVTYRTLVQLAPGSAAGTAREVADQLEEVARAGVERFRVETWAEAQPALRDGLRRTARFLGLVALLSLLVGGVGVGETVRAWLAGRMDAIATLKCLGARPREVLALYLGQTVLLGLAGSAVGLALGVGVMLVAPALLGSFVPAEAVNPWQPAALARGLGLGVSVALLASIAPLSAVLRVSPARVLRQAADPLPSRPWAKILLVTVAGLALAGLGAAQSGSVPWGLGFTAGIAALTALLAGAGWSLARLAGSRRGAVPVMALRHGLAALARPGSGTLGSVVALGLGVLVVLAMALVEAHLAYRLSSELPRDAPSAFLIDIQPTQWEAVEELLEENGALSIDSVPVVTARLTGIDDATARELAEESDDRGRRWALTREQRLTYQEVLPADNEVLAGELWSRPDLDEISVEHEFAADLALELGSRLTFDVQGVPVELVVTSLRRVDWQSFGFNFFFVVEPGVLDEAPQQRIAAIRLAEGETAALQDRVVAAFPNVTLFDVRQLLAKILAVLERVGLGVRVLGSFTVVAAVAILAGAVSAGAARRRREVALLKTLGMTRAGVAAALATEYSLIGAVGGVLGCAGGGVLAWVVVTRGLELTWDPSLGLFALAAVGSTILAALAGLAASVGAMAERPIQVLRGE